jgi:hypothetical protein
MNMIDRIASQILFIMFILSAAHDHPKVNSDASTEAASDFGKLQAVSPAGRHRSA